ncbi:MAG: AAA family ATPase [Candidatus Acidiferrales bacterium]
MSVDFNALGPGLIALVGENGVGKSTLIGCVFAALFRQLPGQKRALYDFCTHPKPEIDLTFSVAGVTYRALHKINPQARQMESYLFDGQGAPLTSGKKEAFQEEISRRIGTPQLFLASYFSSQKRTGNFLGLERSERKQLFITELLGLDRLRRISAAARDRADEWSRQVLGLEGERKGIDQLLAASSQIEDPAALAAELDRTAAEVEKIEAERRGAEETLTRLRTRDAERKATESRRMDLAGHAQKAASTIGKLERELRENRQQLDENRASADVTGQIRAVDFRIDQLQRRMEETKTVETANREVEDHIRSAEESLREKRRDLERSQRESAELQAVPCGGEGWYAACPKIVRSIQARQSLPELELAIAGLEGEIETRRASLKGVPADLGRLMQDLQQCQRDRRSLESIRRQQEERKVIEARVQERTTALERLIEEKGRLEQQAQELAKSLESFENLENQIREIKRQLEESAAELNQRRREREQLIARKAQAEQRRRQIEEARCRAEALDSELQAARREHADFDYIGKVFGPDEIQLCEIQAAGPGVSEIVNDLLEGCFDNKFEVRFRTQRPRADGKGMVDDFDIEVRNKTLDRVCLVDELSGGQFVLVNEAVNLGIAIYNMRQAEGVRHETLFRDETVGALDAKNAKEYVRMLRRAMEISGFHQVIFICHSPQVWEMADRILWVADGRVSLESPPGRAA